MAACSSTKVVQEQSPFKIKSVTMETSTKDLRDVVVLTLDSLRQDVSLDSLYFRGETSPLNRGYAPMEYRAVFVAKEKNDFIMSNDPTAEYGNQFPDGILAVSDSINPNTCFIRYSIGKKAFFHKYDNVIEMPSKD